MLDKLLQEYYKLFPNARMFSEWFELSDKLKIEALKEAVQDKKDLSQTKVFKKYEEKVIFNKSLQ